MSRSPIMQLLANTDYTPRFHGNGFVQIPIAENVRLHVWSPDLPPIPGHNATIHDHAWDMRSAVLLGTVGHRTWARNPNGSKFDVYDVGVPGETGLGEKCGTGTFAETGFYQMFEGSIYSFSAGQLHQSVVSGWAATLMVKLPIPGSVDRHALCPKGETPVDAFAEEHQPSKSDMWEAIRVAFRDMSKTGYSLVYQHLK